MSYVLSLKNINHICMKLSERRRTQGKARCYSWIPQSINYFSSGVLRPESEKCCTAFLSQSYRFLRTSLYHVQQIISTSYDLSTPDRMCRRFVLSMWFLWFVVCGVAVVRIQIQSGFKNHIKSNHTCRSQACVIRSNVVFEPNCWTNTKEEKEFLKVFFLDM